MKCDEQNGIEFALQLHNHNSFTRKDVLDIQQNVMAKIVQPMVSQFHSFMESNFNMSFEQELVFKKLIRDIENPFRECSTEHKLNDWLKSKDMSVY